MTIDEAMDGLTAAMFDEAMKRARAALADDIVAGFAGIDWRTDGDGSAWEAKFDSAIDALAGKMGGHNRLSYMALYMAHRLVARGFVDAEAVRYIEDDGEETGMVRTEVPLSLGAVSDGCEGLRVEFYGEELPVMVSLFLKARE